MAVTAVAEWTTFISKICRLGIENPPFAPRLMRELSRGISAVRRGTQIAMSAVTFREPAEHQGTDLSSIKSAQFL
jgi:hypothetical protein